MMISMYDDDDDVGEIENIFFLEFRLNDIKT